uniref:Uncharacterized protein n=1 Tax=Arundo donax TaxID=35708 RepID=A0A0A9BLB6_ARUDO
MTMSTAPSALPRCSFSPSSRELSTATTTSISGLNTDANRGPRRFTHHDRTTSITPDARTPE